MCGFSVAYHIQGQHTGIQLAYPWTLGDVAYSPGALGPFSCMTGKAPAPTLVQSRAGVQALWLI